MKNLNIFSSVIEYETAKSGGTLITPNISFINESGGVIYLPELDDPYNGHEYVEIGGLKWATMNIGASQPSDYGLYFAWGETQGYTAEQVGSGEGQRYFNEIDYKYGNGTSSPDDDTGMTKYNATDGLTILEAVDDAAVVNWGGSWRMPTTDEFQALGAAVNTTRTKVNNVDGILCTDKTDSSKTLFFPAGGFCGNSVAEVGSEGNYWASSLHTTRKERAHQFLFNRYKVFWGHNINRLFGFSIRPVAS